MFTKGTMPAGWKPPKRVKLEEGWENFEKKLLKWIDEIDRNRHGATSEGFTNYDVVVGLACYEMLRYCCRLNQAMLTELNKRNRVFDDIFRCASKDFPGDYFTAYNEWHSRGYDPNDPKNTAGRLAGILAFSTLAEKFQGTRTGLDVDSTVSELIGLVKEMKHATDFMKFANVGDINNRLRDFWENRNSPSVPQYGFYDRYTTSGVRTEPLIVQDKKPKDLFERGKTFEKIGALSAAERSYAKAGETARGNALAKFAQGKPMGQDMDNSEKYEKEANRVHQKRVTTVHSPAPPPGSQDTTLDFESCIIEEKPNVTYDDVVGNEEAIEALKGILEYPLQRPDLYPTGFPTTVLLHGPPGCGKTHLAKAVATEAGKDRGGIDFLEIDSAAIMSKWVGDAEKNVSKLFDIARKRSEAGKTVVIFMDELDDLLSKEFRHDAEKKVRNQFQREISGFKSDPKKPIFLIGATNKPWEINDAMVRRFEKRIYVELPDKKDRIKLFAMYFNRLGELFETDDTVKLDGLAELTENYSADDIMKVCNAIAEKMRRKMREDGTWELGTKPSKITMRDCEEVIEKRKPSIDMDELKKHQEWKKKHGAE